MLLGIVCLLSTCFTTRVYAAYNITEVLSKYSDYSEFNRLLTSSGLAKQINSKDRTITLLVVNNGAVGSLSGKPEPTVRAVLSLHIVLDYLDKNKIQSLNKTTTLTTLYQETGNAKGDQGFLNATKTGSDNNNNQLMFGNGKEDAQLSVSYKKVVTTQSSHYSVIEVSSVIQAPWADNLHGSPHKAPSSSPDNAPAPSRRHRKIAPASSDSPPVPSDSANADDSSAPAPGTSSASLHAAAGGLAASFAVGLLASLFVMSF
ncbi:Fasciclin-like arabinogalactan protein 3 [Linum grandiflorum]